MSMFEITQEKRERASYQLAFFSTFGLFGAVSIRFDFVKVTYNLAPPWVLGILSAAGLVYSFIYLWWCA